ncbi:MAG: glycoside hydrolase family 88 protein [Bacteroidales bacterium]|nr:glycoside hydrolase family 88 protein [Bacteroidales bacterium]
MFKILLTFALLAVHPGGKLGDLDAVKSLADHVLDNYKIGFYTPETGKEYATVDEIPADTHVRARYDFFDWTYTTGILNSSLLRLAEVTGNQAYADYVKKQIDYPLSNWKKVGPKPGGVTDWNVFYGLRRYNELDFVGTQNGAVIDLNNYTGEPRYEDYVQRAAEHIRHGQQRLADGTLVRDWPEKGTVWADDLYMGPAFMTRYAVAYNDKEMLADVVRQIDNFNKYLWDEKSGLYWHGFYSEKNKPAGFHWGRCNGWIMWGTVEVLDILRPESAEFERLLGYLKRQIDGLKKYQRKSGMWMQVLDRKSYEESSCTSLFAGCIAHAITRGWIDREEYAPMALKAWEALKSKKISNGVLKTVCVGTGIRDEEVAYVKRPSSDKDAHGIGMTIVTGLEIIALKDYIAGEKILWTRPTFNSCSVEMDAAQEIEGLSLEYRKAGTHGWQKAVALPYFKDQPGYRTSLTRLDEDSAYDVRFCADGKELCHSRFFTWQSDVPIAKTIVLDPDDYTTFPIRLKENGTAQGWVKYVAPKGKIFTNGNKYQPTILVEENSYVILEGMVFKGPQNHEGAIKIAKSKGVRVQNCEMYDFGRVAPHLFDNWGRPTDAKGKRVNYDGAIQIKQGCSEIVVERCYIHDSAGRSNSWRYAHPVGTEAIMMYRPDHSTVIRYNDFVGSDLHRFNDCVESNGNFSEDGGFNRDADIYGNFMIFANDDCIELDGGQRNVRCFDNRFEGSLVGCSIQGCMVSPSFVFDNVLSGLGEEFGSVGKGIKTGSGKHGAEARTYIYNNMWFNGCNGYDYMATLESHLWNNVWGKKNKLTHPDVSPKSTFVNNKIDQDLKESDIPVGLPARPCPFILSEARKTDPGDGYVIKLRALPEMTADQPWEVRHNNDMDWFEVIPASGVLHPGEEVELRLHLFEDKLKDRRLYRSCFIVRTPEGLSRPFSFYINTDFVPAFHPEKAGEYAQFIDVTKPATGKVKVIEAEDTETGRVVKLPDSGEVSYEFSVPKAGRYYVMIRTRGMRNGFIRSCIEEPDFEPTQLMAYVDYMTWTFVAPGKKQGNRISFYDLEPGRTYQIRLKKHERTNKGFVIEGLVVTDSPASFEPR